MGQGFEPRLYYINIILSIKDTFIPVTALIDTGCAKSAMSKLTFNKLNPNNSLIIHNSTAKIQTCDGTSHAITGFITINISFPDTLFQLKSQQIMIVEKLSDDFIIGSDILGSQSVSKIQTPLIYFTDGIEEFKVKMNIVTYPEFQFSAVNKVSLLPQQEYQIVTPLKGFKTNETPIRIISDIPQLTIARIAYEDNKIITTISNNNRNKLTIEPTKPLIRIQKAKLQQVIPKDEYMDQDELDKSFDLFKEQGFYQPSVTAYIEDRSNITEADKVEIP